MKARYCSQCGGPIEERVVGGRSREVCAVCQTVFYQNPLPAAAALVLDENRQVLLVKRGNPPNKGMWCLPMGFAETGETISAAALRELHEETGLTGRVLRLIDADSWSGEQHGDLLVATFEVEKIGGEERPGDDAAAVAYFPIDKLPALAFPSNEKAIHLCADLHRDEWAIHDSFHTLEAGSGAEMLSNSLVSFVAKNADYVARLWLADVRSSHSTESYWHLNTEGLLAECAAALHLLGRWLEGESTEEDMKSFYHDLSGIRCSQGVPLHEMLSAIMLLKKQIWHFALSQGVWERPVEMYRIMELQSRFAVFFDKAMYYSARGYAN